MRRRYVATGVVFAVITAAYFLAMIPDNVPSVKTAGRGDMFVWNQDAYWKRLEKQFARQRRVGCVDVSLRVDGLLALAADRVDEMSVQGAESIETTRELERLMFDAAVVMAACKDAMTRHSGAFWALRHRIRDSVRLWDIASPSVRDSVYRLLYGTRVAFEQAMLISGVYPKAPKPKTQTKNKVPSATVRGVTVRSGDLLLSRGTAPTSAFIARGNDYPGNFSHVALVHINEEKQISIIEAHIEVGVAITDVDGYLRDKKFRILLLRLRDDLPEILENPILPHQAATLALERATRTHIPYDFEMNYKQNDALFCSEVASAAYAEKGIWLWQSISHITNPVVVRWMRDFGVRHFITQAPSDLEYDPQLNAVYEWRSEAGLKKDTVDNAVVDAMIDNGDADASLPYNRWMLPVARLLKLYSVALNSVNKSGPIPEGMTPTAALKNRNFRDRHLLARRNVAEQAATFQKTHGYFPPYWRLVQMAKDELSQIER